MTTADVRTVSATPTGLASLARSALRPKRGGDDVPHAEYRRDGNHFDPAALAAYQRLCGFRVSSNVPATFVHVQTFPLAMALMGAADFPFPLLGLVHVHNRIRQLRTIDAAETVALSVRATNLRNHPAGRQVDLEATATVGTETVWTGTSTYLHRGGPAAQRSSPRAAAPPPAATAYWKLPADLGRRYAVVSGDRNPIHLSRLSAKAFGFPRAIAHGMWLNARVLGALQPRLPDAYSVDVAFKTPTFLPSTVAFSAQSADGGWEVDVRNARSDKPHLAATISPLDQG